MAWCHGKAVVGYKADSRSVFHGADNPLVSGLFNFSLAESIEAAVRHVKDLVSRSQIRASSKAERAEELEKHLSLGRKIWDACQQSGGEEALANLILESVDVNYTLGPPARLASGS